MKKVVYALICVAFMVVGVLIGRSFLAKKTPSEVASPAPTHFNRQTSTSGNSGIPSVNQGFTGNVFDVKDGESIQDAVGKAKPGDLIRVFPGTYKETVYIDKDNISLQGVIREGEWPTLDGEKELNDGFLYSGSGILIENFKIINYKGNGIMGQAGNNFVLRNNWIDDTGVYGIFPEFGKNGLIEHNLLSGIEDAAIYVGMSDNIDVRHNEVFESVAGIEIENSRQCLVEYNYVHDNTGGILVFITPGLPIKTCFDVIVRNNYVVNNNHENFGQEGAIVSMLPKGTGIIIMAADKVIIENNIITGNDNVGITITDLSFGAQISKDPESEPYPDSLVILDNIMINNGNNPVGDIKKIMVAQLSTKAPDIVAIGGGVGSCIRNRDNYRTFGLDKYGQCSTTDTKHVISYLLDEPVPPRDISKEEKGKLAYYGVCSGCHAYDVRMIGPPTQVIQALYKNNPQGIADYIANPVRKREDFPEMPPQAYLSEETRLAVAEYVLSLEGQRKQGMGRPDYNRPIPEKKN